MTTDGDPGFRLGRRGRRPFDEAASVCQPQAPASSTSKRLGLDAGALLWPLRPPAYEVENKGDERNAREERRNPQSLPYDMDRQRLLLRRFDRYLPANPAVNLQRTRWSPAPQGDTPQSGNKEDETYGRKQLNVRDVPFSRLLAIEDPVYPALLGPQVAPGGSSPPGKKPPLMG